MQDKRRYKRFSVDILGINGKMMFANEVEIHDISLGGISLKVDKRLNMGSEYTIKIAKSSDKTISLKGSVVWSKISGTRKGSTGEIIPIYSAGMKFVTMPADKIKELTTFLAGQENFSREKVYGPSGLRCSMRFLVAPPLKKAFLDIRESYAVKKLSLGGMLIESESPLGIDDRVPMEILLPGDTQIKFLGRTASCIKVPEEGSSRYDIGIEFIEIAEGDKRKLHEFVLVLEKTG